MTRWLLVLSFLPGLAGGCSFALSGPDPNAPRTQTPSCDTSKNLVIVDGVLATAAGVTALSVATSDGAAAIAPALIGALFVGAAIHGNSVVDRCRRANADYIAAMSVQKRVPVVAEEDSDEAPRPVPPRPHPSVEPAVQTVQPPVQPPPQQPPPPAPAPQPPQRAPQLPLAGPTTDVWADFWKEVR